MSSGGRLRVRRRTLAALMAVGLSVGAATTALADAPNDPGFNLQWALTGSASSIHAPQAWCANLGNVLVADVDTGADFGHGDLAGKLVAGASFLDGTGNQTAAGQSAVRDDDGHGTMTTGIMVANTNNGQGIAGVAPAARALIVKVLKPDATGKASGSGTDVAAGIRYAADYPGVRVINLSIGSDVQKLLGITITQNPLLPAIEYAWSKDVLVVAASGNDPNNQTNYNSVRAHALIVGALARSGAQASYSSPGSNVDAPGGDGGPSVDTSILSTDAPNAGNNFSPNSYAVGNGTSFAAPMVAGTAALLSARGMSAPQIRSQILATEVNGTHLNSARALGLDNDNGPICPPGASGTPPPGGGGLKVTPVRPSRPAPGGSRPAQAAPTRPPVVAPASPSPSPSASPVASPSVPQDEMPSPRVVAHPPPPRPPGGPPAAAVVVGIAAIGAAGFGGLRLLQLVR